MQLGFRPDELGILHVKNYAFAGMLAATCFAAPAIAAEVAPEIGAVDAFQALFGKYPGLRLNHAKGIVLEEPRLCLHNPETLR